MSEPTANDGHRYDDCVARRRRCAEALAGMNPAKLAAMIEACEDHCCCTVEPHSKFCPQQLVAELRGEEAFRG